MQGGEGSVIDFVGIAANDRGGPFFHSLKATEFGGCETWRIGEGGLD